MAKKQSKFGKSLEKLDKRFEGKNYDYFENDSGEPKLHFWRIKKALSRGPFKFHQVPYEHLIIPHEAQSAKLKRKTEAILETRFRRSLQNPMFFGLASLHAQIFPPAFKPAFTHFIIPLIGISALLQTAIVPAIHKKLKSELQATETFPASGALEYRNGAYREFESSARFQAKFKQMTHAVVDNRGNLLLIKHPLHQVPKGLALAARAKLLLWHLPFQRMKIKLQPPVRTARERSKRRANRPALKPALNASLAARK